MKKNHTKNILVHKSLIQRTFIKSIISIILLIGILSALSSCVSTSAINESPTRFGVGVNMSPGIQLGNSNTSLHTQLGYARIAFTGGGGHNNIFQGGVQVRQALSKKAPEGFWVGGEMTYLGFSNKLKNSNTKQSASGFTAGALAGYRFLIGRLPLSFYVAPSYLNRGKFKTNGTTGGSGSSGFYARAGIDIHLLSLIYKKGR